jgi:tRNA(Ile)-lysidine synthase TilS/MesJ
MRKNLKDLQMKNSNVFDFWKEKNEEWLEKCSGKTLAVTFSAGKDSSVSQYFLNEVKEEYNFSIRAFMCAYPHHRYTPEETIRLTGYWKSKGIELTAQSPDESDMIMEEQQNPCRPCQTVRKRALPEIFSYINRPVSDIVIVSGHSLWDIAAYALNRLLAEKLSSDNQDSETMSEKRLLEVSQRFYPFFTMPEGYSVFRPLLHINQPDIHKFCSEKSIPVITESCRYSIWRPKNNLSEFFERFGYKFNYETVFNFAREQLNIINLDEITSIRSEEFLSKHF